MPLTPAEKRKNRLKTHKVYNAYIPLFVSNPFDEKLEKNRYKIYRLAKGSNGKIFEKKLKTFIKSIDSIYILCYNIIIAREKYPN